MPKKGIHALLYPTTYVLRNGASVQIMTPIKRSKPVFLSTDPTCHPAWTGETKVEVEEDSHAARFMKKFGMTQEDLQASTPLQEGVTLYQYPSRDS
eukprot:jgi/Botrbrau1/20554/Bobra.145_2s0101.1